MTGLDARRALAADAARAGELTRQTGRGKLSARRRIDLLLDPGSFRERGMLALPGERVQDALGFGDDREGFARAGAGDGILVGAGLVDGRPASVASFDFSVLGGSNGEAGSRKLNRQGQAALENGHPFVVVFDGGGHRIQEGLEALTIDVGGAILPIEAQLSGWAPMAAVVAGPVFGGTANFAALMDLVVLVDGMGSVGLSGPALVRAGTGATLTKEDLGGAALQAGETGLVDLVAEDEPAAAAAVRRFLGFLPSNADLDPPVDADWTAPDGTGLAEVVPESPRRGYDVRKVLRLVADEGSMFELGPSFARNAVCALARIEGRPVGLIANQPLHLAGTLDAKACEKLSRFVGLCDAYGLPLVSFVDVPGFHIGLAAERSGIARRASALVLAMARATVPLVTVVLRKGYGMGYIAMGGGRTLGAEVCVAWPGARIAAMSIEGAVDTLFRGPDAAERRQERIDALGARTDALSAAEAFAVDDVIAPAETRAVIRDALRSAARPRTRARRR